MFSSLFPSSPVFEHQDKKNETLDIETSLDKKSFRDSVKEIKQNTIGQLAKLGKSKFWKAALFTAALNLPACNTISKNQIDELTWKTISTEVATQLSYTNSEVGEIINNNDFSVTGSTIHKDSIQNWKMTSYDKLFPASNKNQNNITENSENFIISLVNWEKTEYDVLSTPLNINQNNYEWTQADLLASELNSEKNVHKTQNSDSPEISKQTQSNTTFVSSPYSKDILIEPTETSYFAETQNNDEWTQAELLASEKNVHKTQNNTKETQQTFVDSPYSQDILVEPYFAKTKYATIYTDNIQWYGAVVNNYSRQKSVDVNDQKINLDGIHNILIDAKKIADYSNKWNISNEVFEKYVISNEEGSIFFENYLIQNWNEKEVYDLLTNQNIDYRNVVEIMWELRSLKYLIYGDHSSITDPMMVFFCHHMRLMSTQEKNYSDIKSFINSYNDFGFELNKENVQKIISHLYFINHWKYDIFSSVEIKGEKIEIQKLFDQVKDYVDRFEEYANNNALAMIKLQKFVNPQNNVNPQSTLVTQNWQK